MITRRHSFWIASMLALVACAQAQETVQTLSPDKGCRVRFHGSNPSLPESFTIEDVKGAVLFDSKTCADVANVTNFEPEHVSWSPDSQIVAITGGHAKFLETYLFSRHQESFVCIPVPNVTGGYDNPWVQPLRWIKGRRLIVTISGPHAGKANGYGYRGRATLHVPANGRTCEVHYQYITVHDERLPD